MYEISFDFVPASRLFIKARFSNTLSSSDNCQLTRKNDSVLSDSEIDSEERIILRCQTLSSFRMIVLVFFSSPMRSPFSAFNPRCLLQAPQCCRILTTKKRERKKAETLTRKGQTNHHKNFNWKQLTNIFKEL